MDKIKKIFDSLAPLINESKEKQKSRMDQGFNLFYLISDQYYRENFHSDIISALLSPIEKHGEKNLFLDLFLDMIDVDKNWYAHSKVYQEYSTNDGELGGRIDIFIEGEEHHCVVIENKLNNASDTYRQLPKYYQDLFKKNYTIDSFVYIPLDPYKTPDKTDWSDEEKNYINSKLIIIPAYKERGKSLYNEWLEKAENETTKEEVKFVIKQYRTLLYNLSMDNMSTTTMEKFYNELLKDEKLETIIFIRKMINELPYYLASRIQEKYGSNCSPFNKIWIWANKDAVFEGATINGVYLKIDILCNEYGYDVLFNSPNSSVSEIDFTNIVKSIHTLDDFKVSTDTKNRIFKHFDFKNEKGLFAFLENILQEMRALL